jgi:hypothetical protein
MRRWKEWEWTLTKPGRRALLGSVVVLVADGLGAMRPFSMVRVSFSTKVPLR